MQYCDLAVERRYPAKYNQLDAPDAIYLWRISRVAIWNLSSDPSHIPPLSEVYRHLPDCLWRLHDRKAAATEGIYHCSR